MGWVEMKGGLMLRRAVCRTLGAEGFAMRDYCAFAATCYSTCLAKGRDVSSEAEVLEDSVFRITTTYLPACTARPMMDLSR